MKKNIFGLSLCAIALSGLMMVSCETETVYEVADVPSLTVSSALTVSYDGGDYSFTYSVTNPDADGYATCSADVSWISDVTDNSGKVSFTVAANTTDALRNGNITVAYNYTGGYISKTVGVIQSAYEAPVLTVQPTAVTAAYGGGSYSFTYDVENAADDGELSCTTDATWVSGFDYSTYGTVSFTVDANSGTELRDCEITVKYSYNSGSSSVSKTVAVVQDHPGSGSNGGGNSDIQQYIGTYTATGYSYAKYSDGSEVDEEVTWTMWFYENSTNSSRLWIDGFTPWFDDAHGDYYGTYYAAYCYMDGDKLVVPCQVFQGGVTSGSTSYYCGILCCPEKGYYSTSTPITFTYNESEDSWTSDYGAWGAVLTTGSLTTASVYSYVDCIYTPITIKRTSTSVSSLPTDTQPTGKVLIPINQLFSTSNIMQMK